jgi:hypothetical protein
MATTGRNYSGASYFSGHSDPAGNRFCHALADAYAEGAVSGGHAHSAFSHRKNRARPNRSPVRVICCPTICGFRHAGSYASQLRSEFPGAIRLDATIEYEPIAGHRLLRRTQDIFDFLATPPLACEDVE